MAKHIIAVVKNNKLEFQADSRTELMAKLAKLEGEYVSIQIKSLKPKTKEQLGYYYAVVLPLILLQLRQDGHETMGVPITMEQADAVVKHYCADKQLKRNMTIEDAQVFLDTVIRWATITLGLVIPEPKK